ncbi:hypothetical protein [Chengkuizengella axinellae]|uniref:DUF975 family protein n=1 Tax=Chengkuizengella axinellae TaxID=3064388 RepID=A0ABT9IZ86_9BACL|nr:hypothetical protein [Chengkuizengella sp. 2205SS18-9]MDP5274676.1 hypothetical protein [Chengkuizengella sp. 2205SS18-9]
MFFKTIKEGWDTTNQLMGYILLFSMYQLIWGIFLYRWIQSIVHSISQRIPISEIKDAQQLFMIESGYLISNVDFIINHLTPLIILLSLRWVLSPLLNAGLFYTIHYKHQESSRSLFFQGIVKQGASFLFISFVHLVLLAVPLYWFISFIKNKLATLTSLESIFFNFVPLVLVFVVYAWFIHIVVIYMQWRKTTHNALLPPIFFIFKHFLFLIGFSLIMLLLLGLSKILFSSVSIFWAGLFAIIMHQVQYYFSTYFKILEVNIQYHFWTKNKPQ